MGSGGRLGLGLAAGWTLTVAPGLAAAAAPPPADAAAPTTFPPSFFAPYNPVTAADMVARVPGFELRDGDDRRGFGATAGNLLVNGERPSSKTAASELLKRIPAGNVVRIELLSGTGAGVDVRGQSQVVNVVVSQAAASAGATTFVLGMRHIQYSNRIGWITQASRTFALSPRADLSVDLQSPNILGNVVVHDELIDGTGAVTGHRRQVSSAQNISLQGSANLRWRPTASDSANLNIQYVPNWNANDNIQSETNAAGAIRGALDGVTEFTHNYTAELGGDWEHRFSPGLAVKLIGLVSNASVDQADRFEIYNAPAVHLVRTQDRSTRSGERIGRLQVTWGVAEGHTVEFGGEGAFNFRDTSLDIVSQAEGGPPAPVPVAVGDARVEEVRGEVFISDIWQATANLTLEPGLNYERSRIQQTGDQEKEREFSFLKPRLSATYTLSPQNTLRFSLARDVAQLDFAEFSSAVDFINASAIQGNPDLAPERAWKSRLEWDIRFAQRAALTLIGFADQVEDVHDLVAIGGFDAYGNIGDGTRIGVEARGALPLAPFGVPGAELRVSGLYQRTRVTDPITGEDRSFSVPAERQGTASGSPTLNAGNKDWAYLVVFRQSLPELSAAWGVTALQWAGRTEYRRAEAIHYVRDKPRIDLFVETTRIKPVTVRIYANNILPSDEERTRTFYVGDRSSGLIQRIERRETLGGAEASRVIGLMVSGRF